MAQRQQIVELIQAYDGRDAASTMTAQQLAEQIDAVYLSSYMENRWNKVISSQDIGTGSAVEAPAGM